MNRQFNVFNHGFSSTELKMLECKRKMLRTSVMQNGDDIICDLLTREFVIALENENVMFINVMFLPISNFTVA